MNTPISWIRAYVPDLDCTIQEYVDKMTLSGSNVECYEELDKNLEKIVVGKNSFHREASGCRQTDRLSGGCGDGKMSRSSPEQRMFLRVIWYRSF